MKIVRAAVERRELVLEEPYEIARGRFERVVNFFLRLETEDGFVGLGCAAPDEEVTGESEQAAGAALEDLCEELVGQSALRRSRVLERVAQAHPGKPSALAAVDLALFDLLGKFSDLPLWQILGGYRRRIRTSVTIGISGVDETLDSARRWWRRGLRALKVKGGRNVEVDVERVLRLREELGPELELRFDANQGFSVDDSVRFVRETERAGLSVLEQPTPASQLDLLGAIRSRVDVPVMADESLRSLGDAFRLVRGRLCDVVNIKLMKVGGLAEAMRINAVAKSAGVPVMIGCGDESGLAIAAGLHFALASANVAYADLDGHLGLMRDPHPDAVELERGWLSPRPGPGLGVRARR